MKKLLLSMFCALGLLTANAAQVTDVLTASSIGLKSSSTYADASYTGGSGAQYALNCASTGGSVIQFRSNTNTGYPGLVVTSTPGKLVSVEVEWCTEGNTATVAGRTLNIYGANDAITLEDLFKTSGGPSRLGTIVCGTSTKYDASGDYAYVGMRSSSNAMYLTSIKITWETSEAAVAAPTISCEDNMVTITAEEGADIYYTIDGDDPTAESTPYSAPFAIEKTVTVKAIAVVDGVSSAVRSYTATYSPVYDGFVGLINAGDKAEGKVNGPLTVVYQNGQYLYVIDNSDYPMLVYGNGTGSGLVNGDQIASVKGQYTLFNSLPEVQNVTLGEVSKGTGEIVEPKVLTASQVEGYTLNKYIEIQGVTLAADKTITDATGSAVLYSRFPDVTFPTDYEVKYTVRGFTSIYKEDYQIYPTEFVIYEEPEAELLGTYNVLLKNFTFTSIGEPVPATIEVYKNDNDEYWIAETSETNYFQGRTMNFTYSEGALKEGVKPGTATFSAYNTGIIDGKNSYFSAFLTTPELQWEYGIPFNVEDGFTFSSDAGLGWFEGTLGNPQDIILAYIFENVADEPEEPAIEYDITGNWTAQEDMEQGYGDGTNLAPEVTIPVKAAYVEGKLILTPMFKVSDAPLAFIVDTESGEVVAETTVAETLNVEGANYDYFYVGNDSRTNITGQLYNISDEQSRLTLETWAYAADYSSFGPEFEGSLFNEVVIANNVIILDYYFEDVPMYVAPTVEIINFTPAVDEEAEKLDGQVTVKCSVEVEATQATEDEVVLLWGTTDDEDNLIPAERVELVETEAVGTEDSVKTQHIFRIALPYDSEKVVYLQAKTNSAKTEVLPFEITKEITKSVTGVDNITVDADSNVRYFNLHGVEISRPAAGTVVIRVSGDKAVKELVK